MQDGASRHSVTKDPWRPPQEFDGLAQAAREGPLEHSRLLGERQALNTPTFGGW